MMDKNLLDPSIPVVVDFLPDDLFYVVRQTPTPSDAVIEYKDLGPKLRDFSYVTASLGLGATESGLVTLSSISSLVSLTLDRAAWVSLYQSAASRDADVGREIHEDPSPTAGVIVDASLLAPGTLHFNPVLWCVRTDLVSPSIPIRVRNLSDGVGVVTATFKIVEVK